MSDRRSGDYEKLVRLVLRLPIARCAGGLLQSQLANIIKPPKHGVPFIAETLRTLEILQRAF